MNYKVKFLKVKIKSLAEESRIIRKEELRSKRNNALREQLYLHRIHDVRDESRATHIAYGYLRGKPIVQIERRIDGLWESYAGHKIWNRVQAMIAKYRDDKAKYPDPLEWRSAK